MMKKSMFCNKNPAIPLRSLQDSLYILFHFLLLGVKSPLLFLNHVETFLGQRYHNIIENNHN